MHGYTGTTMSKQSPRCVWVHRYTMSKQSHPPRLFVVIEGEGGIHGLHEGAQPPRHNVGSGRATTLTDVGAFLTSLPSGWQLIQTGSGS